MMNLLTAANAMQAEFHNEHSQHAQNNIDSVSTDSRHIAAGALFIALRGENFDGHQFLFEVAQRGAVAAVINVAAAKTLSASTTPNFPLLVVADTRIALGALAAVWRSQFFLPLLAVTGSNGKTSTKEMIASILIAAFGEHVLVTEGNLNNDIGLPLTLLKLRATHRAAIVEMGMNHPGEIAALTQIAKPTIALITTVQRAHLEGMSDLEAIAIEKAAIFSGLDASGTAVFSADSPFAAAWREKNAGRNVLTYGLNKPCDVVGRYTALTKELLICVAQEKTITVNLRVPGAHNAHNALAAAATCLAAGVSPHHIEQGLNNFRGVTGRLQQRVASNGALILDDTYNANPDSVRAAIDVLAESARAGNHKTLFIFGDMGEIGQSSYALHQEVGVYAKELKISQLFALGADSCATVEKFGANGKHFANVDALIQAAWHELTPETIVLVKGSRFMRMERVANALAAMPSTAQNASEKTQKENHVA